MNLYPRNAWYMAGWDKDFPPAEPKAATILGELIALYRADSGRVIALEDRCVHRLAPLSLGRCEGANLRCMYHGLLYAPDGRCVEIPGQPLIPKQARVRAYPVIEKHNAVWVWMGDPARASEDLIADFKGYSHPDWAMEPARIDYRAPAKLIHDNLLDLSHLNYVHASSFAGGNAAVTRRWAQAQLHVERLPRGVAVRRWMENVPASPAGGGHVLADRSPADVCNYYEFLVPGIFLLYTGRYPAGTHRRVQGGKPDVESIFSSFNCHAVTPQTADTTCYFFAFGPQARYASEKAFFAQLGVQAFEEDRRIIEAQQRVMAATPAPRILSMSMDKAVGAYERVVKQLLKDELEPAAA